MIGTAENILHWLFNQEKEKLFEIKEHKEKRSLSQNSYYWVLVNEVANYLKVSKEDVHFDLLKNYSQVTLITVKSNIDIKGFVKYFELEREAKISGVDFKVYKVFKGSSEMNKNEFSLLLEGIIQEANQLGISTLTKEEIEKMRYIENEKFN